MNDNDVGRNDLVATCNVHASFTFYIIWRKIELLGGHPVSPNPLYSLYC